MQIALIFSPDRPWWRTLASKWLKLKGLFSLTWCFLPPLSQVWLCGGHRWRKRKWTCIGKVLWKDRPFFFRVFRAISLYQICLWLWDTWSRIFHTLWNFQERWVTYRTPGVTEWSRTSLDLMKDKVKRKTRNNSFNLLVKSQIFPLQKMWKYFAQRKVTHYMEEVCLKSCLNVF